MMNFTYNVEECNLSYDDMMTFAQIVTSLCKKQDQLELSRVLERTHAKRPVAFCDAAQKAARRMWITWAVKTSEDDVS